MDETSGNFIGLGLLTIELYILLATVVRVLFPWLFVCVNKQHVVRLKRSSKFQKTDFKTFEVHVGIILKEQITIDTEKHAKQHCYYFFKCIKWLINAEMKLKSVRGSLKRHNRSICETNREKPSKLTESFIFFYSKCFSVKRKQTPNACAYVVLKQVCLQCSFLFDIVVKELTSYLQN